jgi:hypothetical protein
MGRDPEHCTLLSPFSCPCSPGKNVRVESKVEDDVKCVTHDDDLL